MKKNQVPQDDENLFEGKFGKLQYALDEDGNYVGVQSVGWEPENTALQNAWEEINENVEEAKQRIKDGLASPLLYHMEKNLMDAKLLADHAGFFKFTVKRHLKPAVFQKLSDKKLQVYADVFKITIDELKKVE